MYGDGMRLSGLGCALALVLILAFAAAEAEAAFPGANGRIAFRCGGVCTMAPDGTGLRVVSPDGENPAWSPDGRFIAFNDSPAVPGVAVYLATADGSAIRKLVDAGEDPTWSPDGREILYMGSGDDRGPGGGLRVIRIDGSGERQLTSRPPAQAAIDSQPAWSPDGTRIAFSRIYFKTNCSGDHCVTGPDRAEVYSMNADGTGQQLLVADAKDPSWSPDGQQLVVTRDPCFVGCGFGRPPRLAVIAPPGGAVRDIGIEGFEPAWAPDGSKIAFNTLSSGRVHTAALDGTDRLELCLGDFADWQPLGLGSAPPFGEGPRCAPPAVAPSGPADGDEDTTRPPMRVAFRKSFLSSTMRARCLSGACRVGSASVTDSRGASIYRVSVRGRFRGQRCAGKVRLVYRARGTRSVRRMAGLAGNCRYRKSMRLRVSPSTRLPTKLRVRQRFLGNTRTVPGNGKTLAATLRRRQR